MLLHRRTHDAASKGAVRSRTPLFVAFFLAAVSGCDSDGGVPTGAVCTSSDFLTYELFGRSFMERYCLRCHSSTLTGLDRNGAPQDHDFDTLVGVLDAVEHIDALAGAGPNAHNTNMPPDEPSPSDAERHRLAQWLACELERQADAGVRDGGNHAH